MIDGQTLLHYGLHLVFPGLIAYVFFRKNWKLVWLAFLSTMLIDLDHLLATPIFDPNRCSIGFHPLHQPWSAGVYAILLFAKKPWIQWVGLGLIWHLATDMVDCALMNPPIL